ncbi:ribonuclease H-like domain-containing protein [Tanacetum coccineum]
MEFENTQNNALAKLPMLKLGEYEMWEIRIKQYFQIQDYALWEVIENGNSWVPIPVTTPPETGTSTTTKMTLPATIEEKTCKKNDVKARSLLLMALPNEHQLTFDQYVDAQSMFAAIKARFGGNEATKKTQKALLKQQYENFSASSSESLDSIFNRLQKLVSRLAILGVVTPPEDLNVKFLRSLPSEWDTHVVVWMNKPDFDTMGLDDLYNNFKIVEQKVKKSAGASNDDKNLAFVTTSGASSTNNINTVNPEVSTATTKVNTASTEICTASFSDATVYAFLSTQPKGSQLVHEDLEQLHDDDLEEMDLKWNMALLSMRARKFYQRTGRKIIIDGSNTAGYDKSKVECFNCHKMGHFARECRAPRSKDNRNWNQGSSTKTVKIEDASEKAMCAIDGAGFDWSDMAEEEIQANMALMAFSDSEVKNDKSCSKNCLKNYEALKKQYDDLLVKLSDTDFKAATYKRGLATLEGPTPLDLSYQILSLMSMVLGISSLNLPMVVDKESDNSKENTDDSLELKLALLSLHLRSGIKSVNTAKPKDADNVVKRNRFNVVKASACWVWMPKNRVVDHVSKNISASVTLKRLDYIDAQGRFKSVMAWMDAQAQGRQECSKEKEESREECSKSRKTKKMKWEDCWELNTTELVLPSQQLVLLEENRLKTAGYKVTTAGSRLLLLVKKLMLFGINKIHTDNNIADLLTKAFDVSRFTCLVASIGKRGRDTKIPQSGGPLKKVGNEAVHKELGDRMERATTTASSFEAEHDSGSGPRCQETTLGM